MLLPVGKFITRNYPNGYVTAAGGLQETKLTSQPKYCSAKHVKYVKVSNG